VRGGVRIGRDTEGILLVWATLCKGRNMEDTNEEDKAEGLVSDGRRKRGFTRCPTPCSCLLSSVVSPCFEFLWCLVHPPSCT
jgi:hypothetical protein